jgi:CreA protein
MKKLGWMLLLCVATGAHAEAIGEVDTVFKWIGPDHKIVVDAYDDPKVGGISCYVSRAKTGGV